MYILCPCLSICMGGTKRYVMLLNLILVKIGVNNLMNFKLIGQSIREFDCKQLKDIHFLRSKYRLQISWWNMKQRYLFHSNFTLYDGGYHVYFKKGIIVGIHQSIFSVEMFYSFLNAKKYFMIVSRMHIHMLKCKYSYVPKL